MLKFYIIFTFMLLLTTYSFANWPDLRQRDTARQAELRPRLEKIRQDHPRIFCHTEDFVEIRQRIKATPEIKEVYGWLLEWAKSDQFYRNLWATPNQLIAVCVAYRISQEKIVFNHAIAIADYLADEASRWRIEVRSKELSERQYFLHVLSTTDAELPLNNSVELLQADGQLGVVIKNSDNNIKVLFTTNDDLKITLTKNSINHEEK